MPLGVHVYAFLIYLKMSLWGHVVGVFTQTHFSRTPCASKCHPYLPSFSARNHGAILVFFCSLIPHNQITSLYCFYFFLIDVGHFKSLYWFCYNIVLVFWLTGMWNLTSPNRDGTTSPALEREIPTLDCQGSPLYCFYNTIQNSL